MEQIKKYKCGCVFNDGTIIPCLTHFVILEDMFNIRKGSFTWFKPSSEDYKSIINMLEDEEKERLN